MSRVDPAGPAGPPETVLVVDDTPSKRYVLASWLRRGGYTVLEAATGAEALRTVGAGGIDLVLLDVRLPDMSGFEVCERIKSDPDRNTPVVHVSAAAVHTEDRTQGLQRGADAYLVEPIEPDELLATAQSILRYYKAREQAEMLAERLANLARVSVELGDATNQRAVLRMAAAGAARIFRGPAVIVATGNDGGLLVASCTGAGQPGVVQDSTAAIRDEAVGITVYDQSPERWPQVPWPVGTVVRVLAYRRRIDRPPLYVAVPVSGTLPGNPVLTLFGQQLASALETMRVYDREHDLALTLQRSLLPQTVPAIPGFDIAVRYVPASDNVEIGGDFYEVVRLGDTVMVAVGDVGGHSLHAATVMAELRHATRAYLADGHRPAAVLDRLNRLMCDLMPGETATMCLMAIDLATGRAALANAGHPPPVLRTRTGIRTIDDHTALLGIRLRPPTEVELTLEPDDVLVLYTDGLIETPSEIIDDSLARLVAAMADAEPDLEAFASRLLRQVGPETAGDDIAMVIVQRR